MIEHCCDDPADVHVQFTQEVKDAIRKLFATLGCSTHEIQRFGDGRYCNKIAQLRNLRAGKFSKVVLLDTDTVVLADLRPHLSDKALMAKIVDFPNPSIEALKEIARRAGIRSLPALVTVDGLNESTYSANCNGGFYSIPRGLCQRVDEAWRRWAFWLLDNSEPLTREGKGAHVDQVAMWLAIHRANIPFKSAPSNLNYYVHSNGEHRNFDSSFDICLIHYHDTSINVLGLIEPNIDLNEIEKIAIAKANEQIGRGFENRTFWNLRYSLFLERGSGVGSRGENLWYKRRLLINEGAEQAQSVLDVGCGDLEVVKTLELRNYLGLDSSEEALEVARRARPEWKFQQIEAEATATTIPSKCLVLCFEVLIHQRTEADYLALINFLATHTEQTLLVSGYEQDYEQRRKNPMVFFYESLEKSLRQTGKFCSIRKVGAHSDVSIYRCDVSSP